LLKKKIKFLLVQYRHKRRRKVAGTKKSGSGADDVKVLKWFAYQRFTFLDVINKPTKTKELKVISFTVRYFL
jgi:hypothetical protein